MYLLIDGKNLVYRAFYGMPDLKRSSDGFPTGAIYGWCRVLWKLADEYPNSKSEVFWDAGYKARTELSIDYKVHRKPVPDAMKPQIPVIEKLTTLMGYDSYKEPGMEADDLLASRAWCLADKGEEVLIVSADKDFAQCVTDGEKTPEKGSGCDISEKERGNGAAGPVSNSPHGIVREGAGGGRKGHIHLLRPPPTANPKAPWTRYDYAAVCEKFGVCPEQIADYLAIMGDASDNVIGIEGVGPKRAADWLKLYKTIDGIIDNSGRLTPKSCQDKVYQNQELLKMNRQLTTLHKRDLAEAIRTPGKLSKDLLLEEFKGLEMKSCVEEVIKRFK